MSEPIKERIKSWSLDKVRFLLAHIEHFIEDENQPIREQSRLFTAQTGLDKIERLSDAKPSDPQLPQQVIAALAPFFEAEILIQRGPGEETSNWWVTDLAWRGHSFHLELKDQVRAQNVVPEITPLQVHRAKAEKLLKELQMEFLPLPCEADAYLLRPTPSLAYVLMSNLASPWALDHLASAHKLVNKSFLW